MKKIKLRKKRTIKTSTKISTIIIFIVLFTTVFINYCGKKVMPVLMSKAIIDSKKMAILIIKNSLNDEVLSTLEDDMYTVIQNKNGEIQTIDFNPIIVNKFLTKTTSVVSENLKKLEKGNINDIPFIDNDNYKNLKNGVISEIPMGIISNNVLLANLGPKVPVKINMVGNVVSNIETKVSNYGINSALLQVIVKVEVEEEVIIPFVTKNIKVINEIPVAIKVINGSVPEYYGNGRLNESSNILSIPIENN